MKKYLIATLMATLVLTLGLLVGCAQETTLPSAQQDLENRIAILETKLSTAESTGLALQEKIEQLEKTPQKTLTEADILGTLQGKSFVATISTAPCCFHVPWKASIELERWKD